jgi:hypothetical protein
MLIHKLQLCDSKPGTKMTALWDTAPCRIIEADLCLRGAYTLHFRGNEYNTCKKSGGDIGIGFTG